MLQGMTLFLLFTALFAQAAELPLHELEAHCWSRAEERGSLLCQNLMLIGKLEGKLVYPELAADEDENKTWNQAHLACRELGLRYSTGFEIDRAEKETIFARLSEFDGPVVWPGTGAYIRHVLCQ